jgi:hypothetical protein
MRGIFGAIQTKERGVRILATLMATSLAVATSVAVIASPAGAADISGAGATFPYPI